MPSTQKYRIKDLAKANKRNFNFCGTTYINYVDISCVVENKFEGIQKLDCVEDTIPSRAKKAVEKNTIVYSAVRPNLKHYGIVKAPLENMVVSTGFITLDLTKKIDPNYFYYNITRQKYTDFLHTIAINNASTYPAINPSDLEELEIEVFDDFNVQKSIGDLLYTIDNKIELNNKINSELEAMAQTLYNYWFVQFDFPDGSGRPYKSAGGEMIFNPTLGREIPAGWEVVKIADYVNEYKGGDWGKKEITGNYTEKVRCIRGTDFPSLVGREHVNAPARYILPNNTNKKLSDGDLIVEISGGSPIQSTGRICYINQGTLKRFNTDIITSNFCKAISLKNINASYFIYLYWLRLYEAGIFFNFEGKTTGIKNLLFDTFVLTHFMPGVPNELLKSFNEQTAPLFSAVQQNLLEAERLATIRDFLLPMLMNGQITV
ncbi:MAG: restriction endonuclease subunit S [Deltaproteobacteria bacterium]|jgi:type I restriction enzyme S subunit|nr:restriction endonuclease subunit S [Deltaproteobacteria bacterium]